MAPRGRALETRPHPRSYGTFARVLAKYVRDERRLDLATAIRKMTSMPAAQLGLEDRGRIGRGMKADLVVFDPERVQDLATFDDPHRTAAGFAHVLVNGVAVLRDGERTSERPGRALR
jgi:N-acyl-D-amino-acid deacylase